MTGSASHKFEPWSADRARQLVAAEADRPGALLPVLHALQSAFGFISDEAVALVAHTLNLSRAEIHGAVSFYHDFRRAPGGRHRIKLCRAEACQAMGGDALADHARKRLGVGWGETTADGKVTLEPVYCLGLCACAPSAMVDGEPVGRLDAQRVDAILKEIAA